MTDEVRIIDVSDAENVPGNVLEGIEDAVNGRFATKEELRGALLNDDEDGR